MEDIQILTVKEADYAQLLQLYRLAGWWQMDENPNYLKTVQGIVQNSFSFVIVKTGNTIIGMGRAISDGVSDAYIQDVTVHQDWRGKGLGKAIIRQLMQNLKDAGLQWIGLISEPGYQDFYNGLGFSEMKGYTPFLYEQR